MLNKSMNNNLMHDYDMELNICLAKKPKSLVF